ncbi:tetratricopeptide repeat protein [Coleofasciculus sp. FACHB-712]|uniref:tetratricopeptide repeat protein n=1 Tax=Coleofasciculus sp. FACHB-712 TaxID=2692789 RepID=UPI001689C093|nr:tetratricopeptide repeat protein [Coleofasciculus sp. FACHB-712]MBD1945695.1 tetratricopeptide repeat protein [Coleofasciculus sp. FACHB-712]
MDTNETANTAPQQKFNPKNFVDYFNLGVDCYQREDKQGAINAWTQALRIDPQNPHAYYYRGVTRAEIGHYNSAVEDFNHAIHINPKYSNAYYQRDKVSQKLLNGSKALSLHVENAIMYYQRGEVRWRSKDYKEAIKDFNQALRINPYLAEAYYKRGRCHRQLKEQEEAIKDLQKAAQLFCDNNQVEKLTEWTPFELGESNREEAIYYLIQYLSWSSSYEQKRLAASAIQKLARSFPNSCGLVIPHLLNNLSYPAPQVREYALKALDVLSLSEAAVPQIKAIAENDPKDYNRKIAQSILSRITLTEDEDPEMNWVEYEDYLSTIEREHGLTPAQKINLINGKTIYFMGNEVDYKGYLKLKNKFLKERNNSKKSQAYNYDYDEEYAEEQKNDYKVNKEKYDTSMDYGYLHDVSDFNEYL